MRPWGRHSATLGASAVRPPAPLPFPLASPARSAQPPGALPFPSGVRKPRAELCRRADDVNNWGGVMNNALSVDKNLAEYAGPGGWNDIDALIGTNPETAVHLTEPQSRTQFNLWSMLS